MPRRRFHAALPRAACTLAAGLVLVGASPLAAAEKADTDPIVPAVQTTPTIVAQVDSLREEGGEPRIIDDAPPVDRDMELELTVVQALDEPANLEVQDTPIGEALIQLTEKTGIPLEIDDNALSLLPYGPKTAVTATIQGQPLRQSLHALLTPIGLAFRTHHGRLLIEGAPPLRRIGRRATWDELDTLANLATQAWSQELFESLPLQFRDAPVGGSDGNREVLGRLASSVGAGSAMEVLTHACEQYGWTWYPDGERIVILSKTRQVERQLDTRVSLHYVQIGLEEALLDLASRAGVLLRLDPGVMASLPPQTAERFSLTIENATVRQALEVIAGQTGLGYFIEPEGIRLTSNALGESMSQGPAPPQGDTANILQQIRANPIVGEITFPNADGSTFAFFLREQDLPPEVDRLRKITIKDAVITIRKRLEARQPQD